MREKDTKDEVLESLRQEFKRKYSEHKRLNENMQEQFMPLSDFFSLWHHKVDELCDNIERNESHN